MAYITDAIHADGYIENNQIVVRASMGYTQEVPVPIYEGSTEITPTNVDIVLSTAGKKLTSDITIKGVPTYLGQTSYSVADSNITLYTAGKKVESDITIDISDVETLAEEISEVVG
jgi:hypothetical protein